MTGEVRVLVRGAGDLATGVAHRLHRSGFSVFMTELPEPAAVRRSVAFSQCVFEGSFTVEGIEAVRAESSGEALELAKDGARVPVIVDPGERPLVELSPVVLVDGRMAKRNLDTSRHQARVVIGLGPGFSAGQDVHAVVETMRGHHLGRVIYQGQAQPHTGVPAEVGGSGAERLLRAPSAGTWRTHARLGEHVTQGQLVAEVWAMSPAGHDVRAQVLAAVPGMLRGLLRDGAPVRAGQKAGDIDPRPDPGSIWLISDKARAVGGGVLEAICCLLWGRLP
ncbi:MAG: selenium-dependent molybdenum cofactor biosynthesis protein YqeB [Bacillota bacterium]